MINLNNITLSDVSISYSENLNKYILKFISNESKKTYETMFNVKINFENNDDLLEYEYDIINITGKEGDIIKCLLFIRRKYYNIPCIKKELIPNTVTQIIPSENGTITLKDYIKAYRPDFYSCLYLK